MYCLVFLVLFSVWSSSTLSLCTRLWLLARKFLYRSGKEEFNDSLCFPENSWGLLWFAFIAKDAIDLRNILHSSRGFVFSIDLISVPGHVVAFHPIFASNFILASHLVLAFRLTFAQAVTSNSGSVCSQAASGDLVSVSALVLLLIQIAASSELLFLLLLVFFFMLLLLYFSHFFFCITYDFSVAGFAFILL